MLTEEQKRQERKKELVQDYGCLPEEATEWSHIDFHSPNISPFIVQFFEGIRREYQLYMQRYGRFGLGSYQAWKDTARRNYVRNGCVKGGIGKVRPDVWRRLHTLEDAWILLNPDYMKEKQSSKDDSAEKKRNLRALEKAVTKPKTKTRKYTNRRQ